MSYIDAISQAATASKAGEDKVTKGPSDEVLGKEDFLTLLVAQLQNQDPLNPDEPTEFTAQLAQFSSLEQLFNLNESMDNMASSFESSDKMAALETIGKDVVYESSTFSYNGGSMEIGYKLDGHASDVKMYIQKDGATVKIIDGQQLSEGSHFITWDGFSETGIPAPTGDYKIVLQAQAGEGETLSALPLIKSEVTGVDLEGANGGTLITTNGETAFNAIIGVYDRGAKDHSTAENSPQDEEQTEEESETTVVDDILAQTDDATDASDQATI